MMTTRTHPILTVPNLLSLLRLCLIPVFVSLYRGSHFQLTAAILLLSGLTDVVDGWYARRYGAVSDLGKVLDPIADKLTQAAMLLCLASDHPALVLPLILLVIKEVFACVSGLIVIHRTAAVPSAVWHGKATTLLLYLLMLLHVLWKEIPAVLSNVLTALCIVMMLLSMTLYTISHLRSIRSTGAGGK